MPRFFIPPLAEGKESVELNGENAHHISRSLRMAVGDPLTLCDGTWEYDCIISGFTSDTVKAVIRETCRIHTEPRVRIRLFQALPKGDKLDQIIQKSVECGVCEIIPFESRNCVVKVKPDAEATKMVRRQKIAEEAAKQCGRGRVPTVGSTVSIRDLPQMTKGSDLVLFCYETGETENIREILSRISPAGISEVSVVIGSEGGFTEEEAMFAKRSGFVLTGLGPRILRAETAPVFVLSCLAYALEF